MPDPTIERSTDARLTAGRKHSDIEMLPEDRPQYCSFSLIDDAAQGRRLPDRTQEPPERPRRLT